MTESGGASWWIYSSAAVEGPFTVDEMLEAIRLGRVQTGTQVCQGSQGPWVDAGVAFPSAFAPAPPQPPTPPVASGYPTPAPLPSRSLGAPVDVGMSVFLSLITAGIWWLVWVYPRLTWYSQQSGRPMGARLTYFWLVVGLGAASVVSFLIFPLLWFPLYIASVVFGCLLTVDLVRDQEAIALRNGWGPALPGSVTTLVVLSSVAGGMGLTVILLPIAIGVLVFYFLYFFRNHNVIAGLLEPSPE